MCGISKKSVPVHVTVHYPKTEEGRRELAVRTADVHADTVSRYIKRLKCSSEQKTQLINKIIATAEKEKADRQ